MSAFWSGWVICLLVLTLGITLFLFVCALRVRIPTADDGTTGHVWAHGTLREGVRRLPWWWVAISLAAFVAAFVYLVRYPGFGRFEGTLGWTSAHEWQGEAAANDARLSSVMAPLGALPIEQLARNAQVRVRGRRLYLDNCAACHGSSAHGNRLLGAPDLTDRDWLYGGDGEAILTSILDGRSGVMPAWGPALGEQGIAEVVAYVLSFDHYRMDPARIAAGKARYATLCVACHGVDGRGNKALGAPDLTDDVWIHGNRFSDIAESVRRGRNGVMPAWRGRLHEDEARAVAAWVYAQGGGPPAAKATP